MKVALDAAVLQIPCTGVAKVTLGLYRSSIAKDHTLQITALHRKRLECPLPDGIRTVQWGRSLPDAVWRQTVLPLLIARSRSSVVHFPWNGHTVRSPKDTVIAMTLHDVLPLNIPRYFTTEEAEQTYRKRLQRDLDLADVLFTDSQYSKEQIAGHFRLQSDPIVLQYGPTIDDAAGKSGCAEECAFFLYVGGYDPRKGVEAMIRVLVRLRREGLLDVPLILTGQRHYYSTEFAQLVTEATSCGAVQEHGYVPDTKLAGLYRNALALVYPSKYEGFGLPPLEAMASGCPVITTRGTSLPEVCGGAAYYIDPDNEREFARAILDLRADVSLRARLRDAGFAQAARFSWDRAARQFLSALENALHAARSSQR